MTTFLSSAVEVLLSLPSFVPYAASIYVQTRECGHITSAVRLTCWETAIGCRHMRETGTADKKQTFDTCQPDLSVALGMRLTGPKCRTGREEQKCEVERRWLNMQRVPYERQLLGAPRVGCSTAGPQTDANVHCQPPLMSPPDEYHNAPPETVKVVRQGR